MVSQKSVKDIWLDSKGLRCWKGHMEGGGLHQDFQDANDEEERKARGVDRGDSSNSTALA